MRFRFSFLVLLLGSISLSLSAQPLGILTEDLHARDAYAGQSTYMDFYHGLALSQEGVDVSLCAPLSIQGTVSGGRVFEKDIQRLYPFPNRLVILRMSGEEIRKYLEKSYEGWVATVSEPDGPVLLLKTSSAGKWGFRSSPAHFDSGAGLDYTVDITRPAGERVVISSLAGGRAFEPDRMYGVAITDYRAHGAGGLLQAAGLDPGHLEGRMVSEGKEFRTILREYLAEHGTLDPAQMASGSWKFIPEELASEGIARDLALVFGSAPYDTRAEIMADPAKAGGEYYMYETDLPDPTPAPKGYKPFYISHFGRHGARYAIGDGLYAKIRDVLRRAHEEGALTPAGEDLYDRYEALYPSVAHREGELTRKGQEQHRQIAARMYRDYPEVFKGRTRAGVVSTQSHRVLLSMTAFLDELKGLDPDFAFDVDYGLVYLPVLDPDSSKNPWLKEKKPYPARIEKARNRFREERIDVDAILGRFFTDLDRLEAGYGKWRFLSALRKIIADIPCLDGVEEDLFADLFTREELYRMWQVWNYDGYLYFGRAPGTDRAACLEMETAVRDIIEKAGEDMASGTALRLRFTHDTCLMPLLSYMGVGSFGAVVSDPFEVENWWRCFDIPMACNLQLVFFRSRKSPQILVKALLNGRETTLPLDPVTGPYYSWDDFKAFYSRKADKNMF